MPVAALLCTLRLRRIPFSCAGCRHRRPIDSEDRRDLARLRPRATIWPQDSASCDPASCRCCSTLDDRSRYCDLAGVSTEVIATSGGQHFREKMLITHRGLSPALRFCKFRPTGRKAQQIEIDLAPRERSHIHLPRSKDTAHNSDAANKVPRNSACALRRPVARPASTDFMDKCSPLLPRSLGPCASGLITPAGTEGYEKAEVTCGGVDADELSAKTMESRKVRGLYFIGEVVDVTGQLGGFNFQWAWASGAAAGRAL